MKPSHQSLETKLSVCPVVIYLLPLRHIMAQPFQPFPPPPGPSGAQWATPVLIINPQYCAPYPVDLTIVRKVLTISDGHFVVTDVNGNVVFKIKGALLTLRDRRVLIDAAGNPIVTLRQKVWLRISLQTFASCSLYVLASLGSVDILI